MTNRRVILKIGGSTLGQHDTTLEDVVSLHQQGYEPIVVHGGGKAITEWLDRQGVTSRFVGGLRVTDEQSIGVVVAVLAGVVNKQLVAAINALGGQAVGLSGADGALLRATVKDPALGLVGEPSRVDPKPIEALLAAGYIPVIAPIGVLEENGAPKATLLNVNADTAAAEIGGALRASQFIFFTDVPVVMDKGGKVLPRLTQGQVKALVADGTISGGMVPKVDACLRALGRVPSALILDGRQPHVLRDCMAGKALGTRIE